MQSSLILMQGNDLDKIYVDNFVQLRMGIVQMLIARQVPVPPYIHCQCQSRGLEL